MDVVRKLTHIKHHLLFDGIESDVEQTGGGVMVLYVHCPQGTVIGIDLETVCLYQDLGERESPLELLHMRHGENLDLILEAVRTLRLVDLSPDASNMLALARGITTPVGG